MTNILIRDIENYAIKNKIKQKNWKKLLNLNFTDVTRRNYNVGEFDLPYISAKITAPPDYIALYSEKNKYHATDRTCISFFNYDIMFDGIFGIFNAIFYNIEWLKNFYIERFKEIKYFIAPDYSICDDINHVENLYRIFRARIVSVWLTLKLKVYVIPLITYSSEKIFPNMIEGMEDCEVVAFSTKGLRNNTKSLNMMQKALEYTVDNLKKLKAIIVYSLSVDDEKILKWFNYASTSGLKIIIPNNRERARKILRGDVWNNGAF